MSRSLEKLGPPIKATTSVDFPLGACDQRDQSKSPRGRAASPTSNWRIDHPPVAMQPAPSLLHLFLLGHAIWAFEKLDSSASDNRSRLDRAEFLRHLQWG